MSAVTDARAWLHGDIDADPRMLIKALLAEEDCSVPRDCPDRNIAVGTQYFRGVPLQERVFPWLLECFGGTVAADVTERCDRFIEEAFELVQSLGYDAGRIDALKVYTWGRPPGEPTQEAGGVMVTLAALCSAADLDMHEAGELELARILRPEIMERIRAKQAAKAREIPFSPLPATTPARNEITVPILRNFDHTQPIGTLSIARDELPEHPDYVFSLGFTADYKGKPGSIVTSPILMPYVLESVSIVSDANYFGFLKQTGVGEEAT